MDAAKQTEAGVDHHWTASRKAWQSLSTIEEADDTHAVVERHSSPETPRASRQLPCEAKEHSGAAPQSVRVLDITVSPKTPSERKRPNGPRKRRTNTPKQASPVCYTPSKRRSSSTSSLACAQSHRERAKNVKNDGTGKAPCENRRSASIDTVVDSPPHHTEDTIGMDCPSSNSDKENGSENDLKLTRTKGTWAGWVRNGQLLRPKLSKDKGSLIADGINEGSAKLSNTKARISLLDMNANSNGRPSQHRRSRAGVSNEMMVNPNETMKRNGTAKKQTTNRSPPRPRPDSSSALSVSLAPAFQQRQHDSTAFSAADSPVCRSASALGQVSSASIRNDRGVVPVRTTSPPCKQVTPKRNLNSLFDKHGHFRNGHVKSPTKAMQAGAALAAPYQSPQATLLKGLGIVDSISEQVLDGSLGRGVGQLTPVVSDYSSFVRTHGTPRQLLVSPVPKIVVTPPAAITRPRATCMEPPNRLSLDQFDYTSIHNAPPAEGTQVEGASESQAKSSLDETIKGNVKVSPGQDVIATPLDHEYPPFEAQETRAADDSMGLNRFKLIIDAFLSEFFVHRTEEHARSMAMRLVELLCSTLDPEGSCEFRALGRPVQIPSLCALCTVGVPAEPEPIVLHSAWVRWRVQTMLDAALEHVITGMIALIVDDRAPFSTPQFMSLLSQAIGNELITPHAVHFGEKAPGSRYQRENALSNWVQLCASAVGFGAGLKESRTPFTMSQDPHLNLEERTSWQNCLNDIDPAHRFITLLRRHMNQVLERGETARARNNLLVVPPSRRGSRKRWQAAHAEMQAQKASHDENFAKLTKGQISEGQYRSEERRRAVIGHPRDMFAALNLVRFVGELFKASILDIHAVCAWLRRLLFETVFTGVPSMYELEAGCALLITVGPALDTLAEDNVPSRLCDLSPSASLDALGPMSLRHSPKLSPSTYSCSKATNAKLANTTISACIARLNDIQSIEEVDEDSKSWCREVIALHGRGWQQPPSTNHMDAVSSAAHAARRVRRGGHRKRCQDRTVLMPTPASWSDDPVKPTDEDQSVNETRYGV